MSLRAFLAAACVCLAPAASAQVVINEVVTHPQQNWNDGSFNPTPGTGAVSDNDEWIELYNRGTAAVSLTGWTLQMNDTSSQPQTLDTFFNQYYSPGSSLGALQPGGYAVFGNPGGAMDDTITLILEDQNGRTLDQVTIGLTGAPGHGMTGAGTSVATESVFRSPNGADTGNDAVDFAVGPATFGAANPGVVVTPGGVVINEVVTQPQRDWNDAASPFDPTPGNGTKDVSDQWVELLNKDAGTVDLTSWTLAMTDATPAEEIIGSGSAFLRFSSGCSLTSFGKGCRAVIGDPAGAMSNVVDLQLFDFTDHQVDDVGLGNGAPSGASTGISDESVSRIPDGVDTNSDPADFDKTTASILAVNIAPPGPDAGLPDAGGMDGGGGTTDGGSGGDGGTISDAGRDGGGGRPDSGGGDSGGGGGGGDDGTEPPGGCSCSAGNGGLALLAFALLAALARRRQARAL